MHRTRRHGKNKNSKAPREPVRAQHEGIPGDHQTSNQLNEQTKPDGNVLSSDAIVSTHNHRHSSIHHYVRPRTSTMVDFMPRKGSVCNRSSQVNGYVTLPRGANIAALDRTCSVTCLYRTSPFGVWSGKPFPNLGLLAPTWIPSHGFRQPSTVQYFNSYHEGSSTSCLDFSMQHAVTQRPPEYCPVLCGIPSRGSQKSKVSPVTANVFVCISNHI